MQVSPRQKFNFLKGVDIDDILMSKNVPSCEKNYKYFISYMDDYKIQPLDIILSETNAYVKSYHGETKWI